MFEDKNRTFFRMKQNFSVLDLKTKKVVWDLPDCINVVFLGSDVEH